MEDTRTVLEKGTKLIANNKKAYHDYFIEDKIECGIALHGTEVSQRRGCISDQGLLQGLPPEF